MNTTLRLLSFLTLSLLFQLLLAQNPIGGITDNASYILFQEEEYEQVVGNLERRLNLSIEESIMLQLSKLKLGEKVSSNLEKIIKANPDHSLISLSRFFLAEHYFYNGDSIKSRYHIAKIQSNSLSQRDQSSYGFIAGVQALELGNFGRAKKFLVQSKKLGFPEEEKLTYYLAFSDYHLDKQSSALDGFSESLNNEEYVTSSRFFIAKINLDMGNNDEVIALAQSELSEEKSTTNSGFYQLIGEAYAKKNNVAKADAYFEKAIQLHPDRPSSALYYQAGVSKFKIGNDKKAIQYLTQSGIGAGEYAQLSAFQLGRLYLQRKELENALIAYTEASASKDLEINEESLYQVAKLHAQLREFTEALNYSDDYLKAFKSGKWNGEIQDLIAETYLRTSNYDLAIEHLENLGVISQKQQAVYQKVTFQKAQLQFNDGLFAESIQWFNKSLKYPIDNELVNESRLFAAEAFMALEQYNRAIQEYGRQSRPSAMTFYGIGYAYYNLENYAKAIEPFERFISLAKDDLKIDGKVRLADCLYATKAYSKSLNVYNSLGNKSQSSYVRYQVGLVLKELGEHDEAISSFKMVDNDSQWKDDATYNLASLQFEKANFTEAEKGYTRLINGNPSKDILTKSLLNRAICYSNLNRLKNSKIDFENILDNHLNSDEAISAILGLQELKQKGFKINNLDARIAAYKSANPNDNSLESIEFETAKAFYFDLKYTQSIESLSDFIKGYPQSFYLPEAKYYIADAHYRLNNIEQALDFFNDLKTYRNNFTGRVFSRLGEINFQLELYDDAIVAYQQLLVLSLSPKDSYNARIGLMKSHYEKEDFSTSIQIANDILTAEWKPLNAEPIAILFIARSYKGNNNSPKSREFFELIVEGSDLIAAESNYQLALLDFEEGSYEISLERLFELNNSFGSYTEWVDRSYLLIADNYLYTSQLFQAKATLRSIIDHSNNRQVIDLAKSKLIDIEQQNVVIDSAKMNKN